MLLKCLQKEGVECNIRIWVLKRQLGDYGDCGDFGEPLCFAVCFQYHLGPETALGNQLLKTVLFVCDISLTVVTNTHTVCGV